MLYCKAVGPSRFEYRSLILFTGRKIYVNRSPQDEYARIIDQNASKLIKITFVSVLVVTVSFSLIIIGPAYAFIFHGEYNSPIGGVLPFTDLETTNGFIINLIFQSAFGLTAFAASVAIEISNCLIINTCTAMSDLACSSMRKLSSNLIPNTFTAQNRAELRDIFVRLQDLENYIRQFNDLYYWKLFLQPMLTTPCVSLAILAQLKVVSTCCVSRLNQILSCFKYISLHRTIGLLVTEWHYAFMLHSWFCATWETAFKWR